MKLESLPVGPGLGPVLKFLRWFSWSAKAENPLRSVEIFYQYSKYIARLCSSGVQLLGSLSCNPWSPSLEGTCVTRFVVNYSSFLLLFFKKCHLKQQLNVISYTSWLEWKTPTRIYFFFFKNIFMVRKPGCPEQSLDGQNWVTEPKCYASNTMRKA